MFLFVTKNYIFVRDSKTDNVLCQFFRVNKNRSSDLVYIACVKDVLDWCFDVFLRRHGFKKLPLAGTVPRFFLEEVEVQPDSHLVIGMESRNDENILISRWTASANEVETEDESHLELDLKSHLKLQGKSTMLLLLELGQYLECTKAHIYIPNIKTEAKLEKYVSRLQPYGFQRDQDKSKSISPSSSSSSSSSGSNINLLQLVMHYTYPSFADPSPPSSPQLSQPILA